MKVKLSSIKPSPDNAEGRSDMNEEMEELIATIKAVGVCEGVSVRPNGKGYEIIGGERRWFAAKKAGLKEVDVIVHEVSEEKARLMRLASLAHSDWKQEQFAIGVWKEMAENNWSANRLSKETGLPAQRLSRAANLYAATMKGCAIYFDGEIQADSTSMLYAAFSKQIQSEGETAVSIVKSVANKIMEERIENRQAYKLIPRIKKVLPNVVAFGNKEDKDYEEHNFELAAILRIPWNTKDFETEVKYMAQGMEDEDRKRWEAARFDEKAMKKFATALIAWKKAMKEVERTKKNFSPEAAQFCANAINEIREVEDNLLAFFSEKAEELRK